MSHVSVGRFWPATTATTISAAFKQSVAQARTTLDCIAVGASFTLWSWQRSTNTVQADATQIVRKSMAFADQNMASAFEFAEKLIYTKHPIEVIQLQEQYLIRQMQALVTQTHELSSVGLNTLGSINSSPHPSTKD
jgi:hypothetical protein